MKKILLASAVFFLSGSLFANLNNGGGGGGSGGSGSGTVSAGTAGNIPQYTGSTTVGPSNFSQNSDGSFGIGGSTYSAISTTFSSIQVFVSSPSTKVSVVLSSTSYLPTFQLVTVATGSNSTAGVSAIPGISYAVTSGSTIYFDADMFYVTAATDTGIAFTLNGPVNSTITFCGMTAQGANIDGTDVLAEECQVAFNAIVNNANVPTAQPGAPHIFKLWGVLVAAADGTLDLLFRSETNGSTATINQGSLIRYWSVH